MVGVLSVIGSTSFLITNATNTNDNKNVSDTFVKTTETTATSLTEKATATTTITTSATTVTKATATATTKQTTTSATITGTTTEVTTTTVQLKKRIIVEELTVESVSVSCLKVEWKAEENRQYEIYCEGYGNPYFSFRGNNICYITGLRENSEYYITVAPLLSETEIENAENYECAVSEIYGYTQAVEVIQEFPYEDGWTACFAGEKASGLTCQPSSGAIYGSKVDEITNTGIRRFENGDYCCAMGLWYGVVGDRFLVELENGQQFTVRICDSKGWCADADGDEEPDGRFHWFGGEGNGKCVIEFIYDDYNLPSCVAFSGSWGYYNWEGMDLCSNILSIKKINY